MGIFEFILLMVLISTVGKVLSSRGGRIQSPPEHPRLPPGQIERVREELEALSERVGRLEEERDFYRELLEHPGRKRGLPSAETEGDDDPTRRS
jgi:hypothetical protein